MTNTNTPKIEPCPFCGAACFVDTYKWDIGYDIVMCGICSYQSNHYETPAAAISAHNTVAHKIRIYDLMMEGSVSRKCVLGVTLQYAKELEK